MPRKREPRPCACGCGAMTKGGMWSPGHDSKRGHAYDKGRALVNAAREELAAAHPMTLRQTYYRLVARQIIPNSDRSYTRLGELLVRARQEGRIPWLEDRLRQPRHVTGWTGLDDFASSAAASYRRDVWADQPGRVEVLVEKDALSGIFAAELDPYGVTLNVERGYGSWSSVHEMARRFGNGVGVTVLTFTDFDPSGVDMPRSLAERLGHFDCRPEIVPVALTPEQVSTWGLPTDPTKASDSRAKAFIREHGDNMVELDSLPVASLRQLIQGAVAARMDLDALARTRVVEAVERKQLIERLSGEWL